MDDIPLHCKDSQMSAAVCLVDVIPQKPIGAIGLGSTITSTVASTVARRYGLRLRWQE